MSEINSIKSAHQEVGLFPVKYRIATPRIGSPILTLQLLISTPNQKITGHGHATQATNPPLTINSNMVGSYHYLVFGADVKITASLTGYPDAPLGSGLAPILLPDLEVNLVLAQDWKSGTASYRYRDVQGKWHFIEDAAVTFQESPSI